MNKYIFLAVSLIFLQLSLKAQSDSASYEKLDCNKNIYLKFSPLAMFEVEPTFQMGVSYPLKGGRLNMQHELGYCYTPNMAFNFFMDYNYQEIRIRGAKIRNNIRVYYSQNEGKIKPRLYFAFDWMVKYSKFYIMDEEVMMQNGAYTQIMDLQINKFVMTEHIIIGREVPLFFSNSVILDLYAGIGMRQKNIKFDKDFNNLNLDPSNYMYFYDFAKNYNIPSIMLGIKVGVKI